MAISIPTANLYLDKRKKLKNNKYPVKLNVYYLGKNRLFGLPIKLTENEWKKINSPKLRDKQLKDIKTKLDYYEGARFDHKLRFELRAEREKLLFLHNVFASVNTSTAFNQNNAAPDETSTKGYTLLDLCIGGNIKMKNQMVYLSISANNIFDKKYVDHLSTLKEVNLYDAGRNISLNLKIPFEVTRNDKD